MDNTEFTAEFRCDPSPPFGMNRSGPPDSEVPQPGTARRSMGLLDVMVDQLPMLTEKGF